MTLLSGVITKRLQLHVHSVTWLVTAILIVALFATSARRSITLFDLDAAAYAADHLAHEADADRIFQVYSALSVAVDRTPAPLRVLARGLDDALPAYAIIRGNFGPTTLTSRQAAPISSSLPLEPSQVVGLFGSLLALLVTCDTVGKEREQGTLQLVLSYPVRRSIILLGEYIAAMLVVLVPIVLCVILFLAVSAVTGRIALDGNIFAGVAMFIVTLALLISTATATGLMITSLVRSSTTALTIGLFIWAMFAVVYPAVAPSLTRLLAPVDSIASPESSDTLTKYWRKAGVTTAGTRATERLLQQRMAQAAVFHRLAFPSPYSLYLESAESSAGTSLSSYGTFIASTERVAAQFNRWEADKLRQYPTRGTTYDMTDLPLDITGRVANEVTVARPQIADAVAAILVLLLWNISILTVAHVAFARYDPRA
jgi:ABC-type transport system involved in multi-copper enzyme maturation permease subunit